MLRMVAEVGVDCLQLGLNPVMRGAWPVDGLRGRFEDHGISIRSGMIGMRGEDYTSPRTIRETGGIRPTKHWKANLKAAKDCARVAKQLDIPLVSFHAGFVPHDACDPERALLVERLGLFADVFADEGVLLALETGQETAATLLDVLAQLDRGNVVVNFDPANMLLYGMGDPVQALADLLPHVRQVHVKDAIASKAPGAWGSEVVVGLGQVDWKAFFRQLEGAVGDVELMIEREAGHDRVGDMRNARDYLLSMGVAEETHAR